MAVITENESADGEEKRNEMTDKGKRKAQWDEMSYMGETETAKKNVAKWGNRVKSEVHMVRLSAWLLNQVFWC